MAFSSMMSIIAEVIQAGKHLMGGEQFNLVFSSLLQSTAGLTATAGGNATNGVQLQVGINELSVVANAADSANLPPAIPGMRVVVINDGAQSAQIFGFQANPSNSGNADTIAAHNSANQAAAATGVAQGNATVASYYCFTAGKWKQLLTA